MDFTDPADHRIKIKESEKIDKYLDFAKELKMPWNISDMEHIYPTPPLGQDMTQGQFFKAEFNRFHFRVFILLD